MMSGKLKWHLDQDFETSAGRVAAGNIGSGPPLVLAHGWPWSSFSWHRLIPDLVKYYTVYWYDMPGYGKSEKDPNQSTALDVQGKIFSEMMDHWKLEKPSVVAHDFGGAITLRAHLLHKCDYEKHILMNVVAMRPWGSEFFDHVGRHVEAFQGLPPHIHRAIVEAYIKGAIVNEIEATDFEALVKPWLDEKGSASFYRQFALADEKYTAEVEPMLADVRCPVSIFWGVADPWIPIERGRALHGFIPHSTFEPIPGLGHLPQLEGSDLVLGKLLSALQPQTNNQK